MGEIAEAGGEFGAREVNRRALVTRAAWTVPVVLMTVATPLAAASLAQPAVTLVLTPVDEPYLYFVVTSQNAYGEPVSAVCTLEHSGDGSTWIRYGSFSTSADGSFSAYVVDLGSTLSRVTSVIDGIAVVAISTVTE